jgi:N-acetyl-anhydromuramyl-L-alanine amidase AmpD
MTLTSPDESGVKIIPNNNYFANRDGVRPLWIILHGTAGGSSAEEIANYFASTSGTSNPVSSHFVIGQDGEIVQCVAESDGAWANGGITAGHDPWWSTSINPNNQTISIEHVKPATDNSTPLTAAQQAASFKLIADICKRWNIPARAADASGGITGHYSMDPVNRANCPGAYPFTALWEYLDGGDTTVQTFAANTGDFAEFFVLNSDGTWARKDNSSLIIKGDILKTYQTLSVDGKTLPVPGLPVGNEVTHTDANGYTWITQDYERCQMVCDNRNTHGSQPGLTNVYLSHITYTPAATVTSTSTSASTQAPVSAAVKADVIQLDKDAGLS